VILALTSNISSNEVLQKTTLLAIRAFFMALPLASQNFKV